MMGDQAQRLREYLRMQNSPSAITTRVLTITSGKGGVGKSVFSLNFALSLRQQGRKVILFDLDIGMANLDVLMGITPRYNLFDMLERELDIWDIMEQGPSGLEFIAGGSGFSRVFELGAAKLNRFFTQLERLQGYADFILLDTGAGLSKDSLRFILSADEVLLVTTPEPTALTDAYAMLKSVHLQNPQVRFRLVVNKVRNDKEGRSTAQRLCEVAKRFLNMEVRTLGYLCEDPYVPRSVRQQQPFFLVYPNCSASRGLKELTQHFLHGTSSAEASGIKGFLQRMWRYAFGASGERS
ncbi:MinD/ParA family protein [Bacillaceae bacterium]